MGDTPSHSPINVSALVVPPHGRGAIRETTPEHQAAAGKLGGRPINLEKYVRRELKRIKAETGERGLAALARDIVAMARTDGAMARYIWDRIHGPVAQKLDLGSTPLQPVVIVHGAMARDAFPELPESGESGRVIDVAQVPAAAVVATPTDQRQVLDSTGGASESPAPTLQAPS